MFSGSMVPQSAVVTSVAIGIPVHSDPDRLGLTLRSLARHTPEPHEIVILPDALDPQLQRALARWSDISKRPVSPPACDAACFNTLASATTADVVVLLEAGAQPGKRWLELLLRALQASPRNGLAGPSTNRSWNEQAVAQARTRNDADRLAGEVLAQYGTEWQTLGPLHSLGDFCFAVRRDVVDKIGAADETYGGGPCWEMDYSVRAHRGGFDGVWARGSYVHRLPFTAQRRERESALLQASKRRYQDKFCGLRLRGESTSYDSHCTGDACEHFAPLPLIEVRLPLPAAAPIDREARHETGVVPMVSCTLPTRDRPEFLMQSVDYFLEQDYPERELVIVDDGGQDLSSRMPTDSRIRYTHIGGSRSIGAKRNIACDMARGEFIAHWDDDDWYGRSRLRIQLEPLLSDSADVSGLIGDTFFDLTRWEFWKCSAELHRRLFVHDVHGGTLVYRRRLWRDVARYPDRSLAEDADFLRQCVRGGARLARVPGDGLFLYVRHGKNSWSFACGKFPDNQGWSRIAEPAMPSQDREFYARMTGTNSAAKVDVRAEGPLVSCIMPTADRPEFVARAIGYFLRQSYENRELIIVDDGMESVAPLIPDDSRIRYSRLSERRTIGLKRNLACDQARGDIIIHWDDDDWMADWRIAYQVDSLHRSEADICGLDRITYLDIRSRNCWQYVYGAGRPWVAGNTLAYARRFWSENKFQDVQVGEDSRFLWSSRPKRIVALEDPSFYVALIHPRNVSPKRPTAPRWHAYPVENVRRWMGSDWEVYGPSPTAGLRPANRARSQF